MSHSDEWLVHAWRIHLFIRGSRAVIIMKEKKKTKKPNRIQQIDVRKWLWWPATATTMTARRRDVYASAEAHTNERCSGGGSGDGGSSISIACTVGHVICLYILWYALQPVNGVAVENCKVNENAISKCLHCKEISYTYTSCRPHIFTCHRHRLSAICGGGHFDFFLSQFSLRFLFFSSVQFYDILSDNKLKNI